MLQKKYIFASMIIFLFMQKGGKILHSWIATTHNIDNLDQIDIMNPWNKGKEERNRG